MASKRTVPPKIRISSRCNTKEIVKKRELLNFSISLSRRVFFSGDSIAQHSNIPARSGKSTLDWTLGAGVAL
jgi:hypothetical protein